MKNTMISIFIALMGIAIGVVADRLYIAKHIKDDIEFNRKIEYRTPLNDEYTDMKVYTLKYFLTEFLYYGNN